MNYKYRIIFTKTKMLKYISHLDLLRLFQRALRRANLPIVISAGFTPRPKISFKRALKLGIESNSEELFIQLREKQDPQVIADLFCQQLPPEIAITEVKKSGDT
ncbi:MAG: TIGR03936 family radical SAM-associated protein [Candidatus Omnitrophota bacterium]